MQQIEPISCPNPRCPQPHDVQKVSIIVQQGTTKGMIAGQHTIISQNALSATLAAPPEPKLLWQGGRVAYVLLFFLTLGILLGVLSFILFSVSEEVALLNGAGQAVSLGDFTSTLLISLSISIVFGLLIYVYRRDHARWAKAKAIWGQLYYCHRCDSVFNPKDLKDATPKDPNRPFVPASRMKELLG